MNRTAVSKRICFIVDHPQRDLEGLVLVGAHLCHLGAEVFLVPMYRLNEVFLLRPDLVLVNYVRAVNRFFVQACNAVGIKVGVLDTEGGILQDVGKFAEEICANARGLDVSLYCTWGNRQYQALNALSCLGDGKLVPTGCPRYDFAVSPWRGALDDPFLDDTFVLVNTNFPFINPRFQPHTRELAEQKKLGRYTEQELSELIDQSRYAQVEVIKTVTAVAERMSTTTFVIRPHPFENERPYQDAFSNIRNVRVIQDKNVLPWIKKAHAVVHHNCSTAIETFLMGREPIHLAWIHAPRLEQRSSVAVSLKAKSAAHLETLLREICTGGQIQVSEEVVANRRQVVHDWFFANDGRAADRIASAIMQTIAQTPRSGPFAGRLAYLARVLAALPGFRRRLQLVLLLTVGKRLYDLARHLGGRGWVPEAKKFDWQRVGQVCERLLSVVPRWRHVTVEQCQRSHAYLRPYTNYAAVRMTTVAGMAEAMDELPGYQTQAVDRAGRHVFRSAQSRV